MEHLSLLFHDYTFLTVSLGASLLGFISGIIGSFAVLKKQSLLGDGISHAALPGVILVFILTGFKSLPLLLLGALISGLLATFLILLVTRYSKVKFDSALALFLSSFFGLGLIFLTYLQKVPNSQQAGLNRFIFGQASTMLSSDILIIAIVSLFNLTLLFLFWKEFKLITFDFSYAQSLGYPVKAFSSLLSLMMVLTIVVGLQSVGVVLMSSLLIAPAVAGRQWSDRLGVMVFIAGIIGAISGFLGTLISSSFSKMPTGPCIVVVVSFFVLISLLFSPKRGIIFKVLQRRKIRKKQIDLLEEVISR